MSDATQRKYVGLFSSVGLVAAIAALAGASCCVLPLALASLGLAGAWIAKLDLFVVYRLYITAAALAVIGLGWCVSYRRRSSRVTLTVLGCATALVLGALVLPYYEGSIARHALSPRR